MISGRTRVFAILGDPVSHSLSPAMHNAAFHALGLEAAYVPLRCRPDAVGPLIHALAQAGGHFRGQARAPVEEVHHAAAVGARARTQQASHSVKGSPPAPGRGNPRSRRRGHPSLLPLDGSSLFPFGEQTFTTRTSPSPSGARP